MNRRIRGIVFGLALAGTLVQPTRAAAEPAMRWGPCPSPAPPGLECALLAVPRDYRDPGGATIQIAVSRLRTATPALRRGVLLFNPGGPGGQGLFLPARFAQLLPPAVLERYDLIGFDPRGIGRSSPTTCALTPEQIDPTKFIPWPDPDGRIDANIAYARGAADSCARAATADLLPHITTANTARDMDRIREALGEQKISYLGYSYGSYLGAVYATLFPARGDRIILDSVVHPGRIWRDTFRAWGPAVEIRFPDLTRWVAERNDVYGLGATSREVRARYFQLAAGLDADPLELNGIVLTGNLFRGATRGALYGDTQFPAIAAIWQLVDERGQITTLDEFPPIPVDNGLAAPWAVLCDDANWPESPDRYRRDVLIDRALFPVAGGMAANIWPCAFWPTEPREEPVHIGPSGPPNVLLVQGFRDPATPYDGAIAMRLALGNRSRLVSVNIGGHAIAYAPSGNRNNCANTATTEFLVTGQLPRHDQFCATEPPV